MEIKEINGHFHVYQWNERNGQCVSPDGKWFHGGHSDTAIAYVSKVFKTKASAQAFIRREAAKTAEQLGTNYD